MKKNSTFKRFLAFLLCAAMMITYMPSSVYTLADANVDGQQAISQEAPKTEESAPAEEVQKTEEPSKDAETPKEETKEETTPEKEEPVQTEPAKDPSAEEPAKADEPSEEAGPAEEQAAEPEQGADEEMTEPEQAKEEPEEEVGYPAQEFEGSTSDVDVYVKAPKGELPEGTTMKVKNIANWRVNGVVKDEMGKDTKVVKAVDITFYDAEGNEIQPKGENALSVSFNSAKFADKDDLSVVHIDDNKNVDKVSDKVVENNGEEVVFKADQFSIYAVLTTDAATYEFYVNDKKVRSQKVVARDDLYEPDTPVSGGKTFLGWYVEGSESPLEFSDGNLLLMK